MSKPRTPKPLSPEARAKIEDTLRVLRQMVREQDAGEPTDRLQAEYDKLQAEYDKAKFDAARAKLFEYWKD